MTTILTEPAGMKPAEAEWIRLNVLPPLWRHPDGIDELRTCPCQAPPSPWPVIVGEPAGRLWNRDGRPILENGALVVFWLADRICKRRRPHTSTDH